MNFSILDIYFVFNIFIFILSLFMFFKTTPDLLKKRDYVFFKMFILSLCFYVIMNTLWTLQEYDRINLPKILFIIVCFFSYSSIIFAAYCFYSFTMSYYEYKTKDGYVVEILGLIPLLVGVMLLIISLFNGMIFSVADDGHNHVGPFYNLLPGSAFIYFVVIVIMSIIKARKAKTISSKKIAITLIISIALLIFWVLLDDNFDRVTIIPIAVFSVIFFMFISLQQSSIYTDALTQMFNRRKAIELYNDQKESISDSNPIYLLLIDINSFKEINDTYGHIEGDEALIVVSKAIKEVFAKNHGFCSRYGGDEFLCSYRKGSEAKEVDDIVLDVKNLIYDKCKQLNKPYDISISVGIVKCVSSKKTFDNYFKEVDNNLYIEKRKYHGDK